MSELDANILLHRFRTGRTQPCPSPLDPPAGPSSRLKNIPDLQMWGHGDIGARTLTSVTGATMPPVETLPQSHFKKRISWLPSELSSLLSSEFLGTSE